MSSSMIWTITAPKAAGPSCPEPCSAPSSLSWISHVAFAIRKRPPSEQDQVAARDRLPEDVEPGLDEAHHPRDREEEADPHQHREREAEAPRARALLLRELPGQDREEDQVVDPEDDLEEGQGQEGDEVLGREQSGHREWEP
jgi:hypothetical protein